MPTDSPVVHPAQEEIVSGLSREPPMIPPKYFYDSHGSMLFERITRLPEYYPTRTERSIMGTHGRDMAQRIPAESTVIELGAGNCEKAHELCSLIRPACYVPIDISADFLHDAAQALRDAHPTLDVRPVVADLAADIDLDGEVPAERRLVFYPGSSIGNFEPDDAAGLLSRSRRLLDGDGAMLVGVDLVKEESVLHAAYNDAENVTAAFNLNALAHLNRLIGSNFDLREWRHHAFFNHARSRIEMHLEALVDTTVAWMGGERRFRRGERIHTENSYKYGIEDFAGLLDRAGFSSIVCWTDPRRWFAVFLAHA
nr:L-histidine N(alpha)-methyltransferase [Propionivibrio soli]